MHNTPEDERARLSVRTAARNGFSSGARAVIYASQLFNSEIIEHIGGQLALFPLPHPSFPFLFFFLSLSLSLSFHLHRRSTITRLRSMLGANNALVRSHFHNSHAFRLFRASCASQRLLRPRPNLASCARPLHSLHHPGIRG